MLLPAAVAATVVVFVFVAAAAAAALVTLSHATHHDEAVSFVYASFFSIVDSTFNLT